MSKIDLSKILLQLTAAADARETLIREYRQFYETNLEPIRDRVSLYKIGKFLEDLAKEPNYFYDPDFVRRINDLTKFSEESFGKPLLNWFRDSIPEVVKLKKEHPYSYNALQAQWLQHHSKLQDLQARLKSFGLHPDIAKRETAQNARYNVVLEYCSEGAKKSKKECKPLMKHADLEQQVLLPQRIQKPLQLNGRHFPATEIQRITITKTLLLDAEVRLFKAKHGCHTDLSFCNSFEDVSDKMIGNPHLAESAEKTVMHFVEQSRIDALKAYAGTVWDLTKLIQLCVELNDNFQSGNFYSMAYLSRALIDHIPPILGCKNFDEVANNYGGAPSFKKAMEHLSKTLKHVADLHIHKQVAAKLSSPTMTQVDFRQDLDLLLGEILSKL